MENSDEEKIKLLIKRSKAMKGIEDMNKKNKAEWANKYGEKANSIRRKNETRFL